MRVSHPHILRINLALNSLKSNINFKLHHGNKPARPKPNNINHQVNSNTEKYYMIYSSLMNQSKRKGTRREGGIECIHIMLSLFLLLTI